MDKQTQWPEADMPLPKGDSDTLLGGGSLVGSTGLPLPPTPSRLGYLPDQPLTPPLLPAVGAAPPRMELAGSPPDRPLTRSGGKMAARKTGARLSWALVAAVGWSSPQRHARSIVVACSERSRIFSPVSPQYLPYVFPISPGLPPAQSGLWATRDSREGRDGRATT